MPDMPGHANLPLHVSSGHKEDESCMPTAGSLSMPDMQAHANLPLHASSGHKVDNTCMPAYLRWGGRCQYAATCQLGAKAGCQRMPECARYAGTCQSVATCQLWAQIGQQLHASLSEIWGQMLICCHMPALGKSWMSQNA